MPVAIIGLISSLLPFLLTELSNLKVISPAIANLISGIEQAAAPIITDAASQSPITIQAILGSISAALSVLQTQTTLSPTALIIAKALDSAVSAGLAASEVTSVDPTALKPEAPIA